MQSHDDKDAELLRKAFGPDGVIDKIPSRSPLEEMERIRKRAERMTLDGQNEITAGADGEEVLEDSVTKGFLLRRLPDDRDHVLRISVGEHDVLPNTAYFTFRGDPEKIEALLKRALKAIRRRNQR